MYYELAKLLSDIAELLIAFAAKRIDIEHLHIYVAQDIDFFIKLNGCYFDITQPCEFTPSPAAMSGKRKEKRCQFKTKL